MKNSDYAGRLEDNFEQYSPESSLFIQTCKGKVQ